MLEKNTTTYHSNDRNFDTGLPNMWQELKYLIVFLEILHETGNGKDGGDGAWTGNNKFLDLTRNTLHARTKYNLYLQIEIFAITKIIFHKI